MSVIQACHDTKDVLDLFKPHGLFLKPISRLNVSVQLPTLKKSGAKISNWEVMERIKEMAKPLTFPVFKIAKSSLEFIRFEAEVENMGLMDSAIAKLDMKMIKLSGFEEQLKVRAAESKPPFPTRHDWDSYFKDNKIMNEMKAGERPDTIYLQNLPTKWFLDPYDRSGALKDKPSEYVLKKVFQTFGEIRALDIPSLDPYRNQMKSSIAGIQTFTFGQDLVFEAYIQYKEYIGFVKAMNSLKGMKLLNKDRHEEQRSWAANIKVDFDKTKHLSDAYIKKRQQERDKLIDKEREKEESERRRKELDEMKREQELRQMEEKERNEILAKEAAREEKIRRRMEREERRRQRKNQRKNVTDEEEISRRIAVEERKLLVAQRKLESIRLLDELLERVKVIFHVFRSGLQKVFLSALQLSRVSRLLN